MKYFPIILGLVIITLGDPVSADDWSVRRSPFDPRIVARYKALLNRRPNDGYAIGKLVSLYRKYRSLGALIAEYKTLARSRPNTFAFQVILGHIHRKTGKKDRAVEYYKRAGALNPKTPTVPAALGALYRKLGKSKEASASYRKALSLSRSVRQKKRYLRSLANIALADRDLASAHKYFDRLVALEPKNIFLRMELAQALARSGHDKKSIAEYRKILTRTRDSSTRADVLKEIGSLQKKMGKDMAAVATYRKAMALTARGHWLRRELTAKIISIYRLREDLKSLITHYEKAWKRRGHFEHEVLGRLYAETGDEERALKAYRAALKASRHAVDTRVRLIAILERAGQDKEVIAEYRKLARIAPGEPRYQLELAKRLHLAGKQKEAFAVLDHCGRRFPSDASVHAALADLYARWGEQKRAMREAQVLVRIEPRDPSHLINLGEQHFLKGKKRKAFEIWRRLLRVIPKRHAALVKLAKIYGEHGKAPEAIEMLKKAIKIRPKHLPYRRALALQLERSRKTSLALGAWKTVLELAKKKGLRISKREARTHYIDILHRTYQLRTKIRTFRMDFNSPFPSVDAGFLLAEAHLKLGELKKAAVVYQKVVKLAPKDLSALTALETVLERQRKYRPAVELLKKMATLDPKMKRDYYQRIANLQLLLFNDKEALRYAHLAVAEGAQDARSYQKLGELYERKEDYAGAIKAYIRALKLAPNRFQVHFALARLQTLRGQYDEAEKLYRQVLRNAKQQELILKAFRRGVVISGYLGRLHKLEKEILPLSVLSANAEVYRRLLVKIYRRAIPMLIHQARQGSPATRRQAEVELKRIGIRGLAPLLGELAASSSPKPELIRILGYLGNPNAVIPLLRIAEREPAKQATIIFGRRSSRRFRFRGRYSRRSRPASAVNLRVSATVSIGRIADERALDGLVRLLKNQEGPIREAAAWALGRIRHRKSARALFDALGDPRTTVQMMACAGLSKVSGPRNRQVLEEVMLDGQRSARVRSTCAWSLGVLGDRKATDSLLEALRVGDLDLQRNAAWALGRLANPGAITPLVKTLWSKRTSVRQAVLWALVQMSAGKPTGSDRIPDVVVKFGKIDWADFVRRLSVDVEDLQGAALATRLFDVVRSQRAAISQSIGGALQRHRDVILRVLGDLDARDDGLALGPLTQGRHLLRPDSQSQLDAAVKAACQPVGPQLASLLSHRDPLIRERALSVYIKLSPRDSLARIRRSLQDPSWQVRARALKAVATARGLGSVSPGQAVSLVVKSLRSKQWREREIAARIAGAIRHASLVAPLNKATTDANGFVRQASIVALARVGGTEAAEALLAALQDPIPHVRAAACAAVAMQRITRAKRRLRLLASDPSPLVKKAARSALKALRRAPPP